TRTNNAPGGGPAPSAESPDWQCHSPPDPALLSATNRRPAVPTPQALLFWKGSQTFPLTQSQDFTAIFLGNTSGFLGIVMVTTPLENAAETFSASAYAGSEISR